jgi:hypothetical protein
LTGGRSDAARFLPQGSLKGGKFMRGEFRGGCEEGSEER